MYINLGRIFDNLSPMEQDFVEAEAHALGVSTLELMADLLREGVAHEAENMDALSTARDRQWKAH
jgi:hypothetical protein